MIALNEGREPIVSDPAVVSALIAIAQVRYAAFCVHFGREPEPDEPLLFDPEETMPTAANLADRRSAVISAAMISNIDPDSGAFLPRLHLHALSSTRSAKQSNSSSTGTEPYYALSRRCRTRRPIAAAARSRTRSKLGQSLKSTIAKPLSFTIA